MVVAEEVIKGLDRFREDVDAIFKIREVRLADNHEAYAIEARVSIAFDSSIAFHGRILQFDVDSRQKCWNGEIDASEYLELDHALVYFSKLWLWYTEQILALAEVRSIQDERLDQLRKMLAEMKSLLRSYDVTDENMGPQLVTLQNSALEEHRRGETEPFF